MALVVEELSVIPASCTPDHGAEAHLAVIFKVASVHGGSLQIVELGHALRRILDDPLAFASLLAFQEGALERGAVGPDVLACTIVEAFSEMANKIIAVGVLLTAITML